MVLSEPTSLGGNTSPAPITDTISRGELYSTLKEIEKDGLEAKPDTLKNSQFGMMAKLTPEVPTLTKSNASQENIETQFTYPGMVNSTIPSPEMLKHKILHFG